MGVGSGLYMHVSQKRCKMGGKLVLIINRKSYMSFLLVPKLVTLNDLERRSGHFCVIFTEFGNIKSVLRQKSFYRSANAIFGKVGKVANEDVVVQLLSCLLYTSPSPRDGLLSRMPSSA